MAAFKQWSAVVLAASATNLMLSIAPATAAVQSGPDEASKSSGEDDALEIYFRQLNGRDFEAALKTAEGLRRNAALREFHPYLDAMRGAALLGLERLPESAAAFRTAREADPKDWGIELLRFESGIMTRQETVALEALDRLIAIAPDEVRELNEELVYYFLRNKELGTEKERDDRRIALARLGFGGRQISGDYLASSAIDVLIERRDFDAATDLLRYVDDPEIIRGMLVQKRYSSLWPQLENMAGDRLERVRASSVASAEHAYAENPSDDYLQNLANAYRHASRSNDAIALESKLPATPAQMAAMTEEMGWAFNHVALAYSDLQKIDQADSVFARLNNASLEKARWRVSMIINRLEVLVQEGRYEQAARLLDATWKSAEDDGSPYARQLVRRLRYCTMIGLGRTEEAESGFQEMMQHAEDARHATIDGLLCGGKDAEAEDLILANVDKEDFQKDFILSLQPQPMSSSDPSKWEKQWRRLRDRPSIAASYERIGRDLPARFLIRD